MKTRREFLKTMLGATAVLTVAVLAPGSLLAATKPKEDYWYRVTNFGGTQYKHVTSGYVQVADLEPIVNNVTATYSGSSGILVADQDGLIRYHWTKGAPNG